MAKKNHSEGKPYSSVSLEDHPIQTDLALQTETQLCFIQELALVGAGPYEPPFH